MPPWYQRAINLIGQPVGISLVDGTGVSGVLCKIERGQIYIMQYLYQTQYATMHYRFDQIQNVTPYPGCSPQPGPYF